VVVDLAPLPFPRDIRCYAPSQSKWIIGFYSYSFGASSRSWLGNQEDEQDYEVAVEVGFVTQHGVAMEVCLINEAK
jgi:hypothetical protein